MANDEWMCAKCGEMHRGVFDFAAFAPDIWQHAEVYAPNADLDLSGDFLSEDFCVIGGKYFFVRGVAEVPVEGLAVPFGFGSWSTLSRENLDAYLDGFDKGRYEVERPWTGWFSNRISTFPDTLNQPCIVIPQNDRQRPHLLLSDENHELARAQRSGIDALWLLEIFEAYGHVPDA
ncbi:MAG: DUF2199 domain-containing protein [Pseudomonadota bacterium]